MPHKNIKEKNAYGRALYRKNADKRRAIKKGERASRIDARPRWAELELAWAAGLFEGEGTVTLTRGGRVMRCRPQCSVASTDRSVVDFFARWGGTIKSRFPHSKTGNCRIVHTWCINSGEIIECFILDILPFIRTERVKEKMRVVLADIRDRSENQQQAATYIRSEARRLEVRAMNHRGLQPLLPGPRGEK